MTQGVKKVWKNYRDPQGEVHTIPDGDVILHEFDDCSCRPRTTPVKREDGSMNYHHVHHAWDGRRE